MTDPLKDKLDELADHDGQRVVWERDSLQQALAIYFSKFDTFAEIIENIGVRVRSSGTTNAVIAADNDRFREATHDFFSANYSVYVKAQKLQSKLYCDCDADRCHPDACTGFEPYHSKLEETGLLETGSYMNTLRVIVSKIATPNLVSPTKYNIFDVTTEAGVTLNRERLLDWIRTRRNRNNVVEYIESEKPTQIDLHSDVVSYTESIEEFYGWLFSDINEKFAHELRERRRILDDLS